MNLSMAYVPVGDGIIRVDAAAACGKRFEGVAFLLEIESPVCFLKIEQGLGLDAVREILQWAETERKGD
jgi:hypothetical protein